MMKVKLNLDLDELERLKDLLRICADCDDFFIVDHDLAEAVLKQLEDVDY
jgi:hypothetical protein